MRIAPLWLGLALLLQTPGASAGCGPDQDGDGIGDACDNCPAVSNPDQEDDDPACNCCEGGDAVGCDDDACESLVCGILDPYCCEVEWDWVCAAEAWDCLCCFAGDGVGDACDSCPEAYNPGGGPVLFPHTIFARATKIAFEWETPVDYAFVWGPFTTSADIGTFDFTAFGTGGGTALQEPTMPASGSGLWYLVRRSCHAGSWSSGGHGEVPGRDDALP